MTFVFQQYSLYPHLSVYDNLAFPLALAGRRVPGRRSTRRVEEVAQLLRIADKLENRATQLSGGEMQRVAIGRALVRRPTIYLMDEPLSSLDAKLRADLRLELKHIQQDLGATILYVTHDQIEAMTMANRIGILDEGRLIQVGTPREIYESPANLYVAARLGQPAINLIPPACCPAATPPPAPDDRRPHRASPHRRANRPATAAIDWIEHLGDQNHLHVSVGGHKLVTLADPYLAIAPGDAVQVDLHRPLFFAENGARLDTG